MPSVESSIESRQRFEQFHHATCQNYSVTDYRWIRRGTFDGSILTRSFGTLTISEITSTATDCRIEVQRNAAEIRKDPRDHFMVVVADRADIGFSQNGRTPRITDGDLFIYDQARPFTMAYGGDTRLIVLTVPRSCLVSRLPEAEHFTARRIAPSSRLGALTATMVRQLLDLDSSLEDGVANSIGTSALDILATTLRAEFSGEVKQGRHGARLVKVKRYMMANLQDSNMTIERIAAAQNLAPRTLHRLFSVENTTPIRWLWQQRLVASHRALEGHTGQVTEVALSFGFNDLSNFSRAFRKQFGRAPRTLLHRQIV
jgi:AraC-like DNA-binding protein